MVAVGFLRHHLFWGDFMLNRLLATLCFIVLHIAYYFIFKSFLTGSAFVLTVYVCTVITFVILDVFLVKLKHKKRGVRHGHIDTE